MHLKASYISLRNDGFFKIPILRYFSACIQSGFTQRAIDCPVYQIERRRGVTIEAKEGVSS